jgi:alginate O-acetyltransferase complex protein AlgI
MLFHEQKFLIFFGIVFAAYWAAPWRSARTWILLAASLYFYASWNKSLAALIVASSAFDYVVARGMEKSRSEKARTCLLALSLIANLGLLAYFKYAGFFLQSLGEVLHAVGSDRAMPVLRVILPVGISFYTFEAINYTVDVYRRRIPAQRDLGHFLLFITFFPHLVAGPIVRARDFLPQIRRDKHWNWPRAQVGAQLFLMGLFKKMAIADRMAMISDPVFVSPTSYGSSAVWMATLAYALQIYCDFSGYTDMALGCAHLLGYKLAPNFDRPYLAANISEFWRRWHISLSTWLRDYLFIPLGGSRGSDWRTARNLLITMTLGGLWHGANWTFVAWGAVHGLLLAGHRVVRVSCSVRPKLSGALQSKPGTALRIALTFLCVSLGWVLFRATTYDAARVMFHRLFIPTIGLQNPISAMTLWSTVAVVAAAHAVGRPGVWRRVQPRLPAPLLGFGYAAALSLALLLAPDASKAFLYFQF